MGDDDAVGLYLLFGRIDPDGPSIPKVGAQDGNYQVEAHRSMEVTERQADPTHVDESFLVSIDGQFPLSVDIESLHAAGPVKRYAYGLSLEALPTVVGYLYLHIE